MKSFKKHRVILFAIFTLIIGFASPTSKLVSASELISAQSAIEMYNPELKSDPVIVKGYIVGYLRGEYAAFTGTSSDNDTLLIADKPTERDSSNIIVVRIATSYKSSFGLNAHPENIGELVAVTGTIETYKGKIGINSTSMEFLTSPEDPIEEPETPVEEPETPVEEPETPVEEPETPIHEPEAPVEEPSEELATMTVRNALDRYNEDLNEGIASTVTVNGYIVGHLQGEYPIYQGDFKNNDNLIIADSPNERDSKNFIYIKIAPNQKLTIGLNNHPENIGKYVEISGSLGTFQGKPGILTPIIEFIDEPGTPGIDPGDPGVDPEDPGVDPEDPGVDPEDPGIDPGDPGVDPEDPGIDPGDPGVDPGDPGIDPEDPGVDPGDPGLDPEDPGVDPEDPGVDPEDPGVDPEDPGVDPEDPGVDPEDPGVDPEDPGVDPEDPGVDPEDPGVDPEDPGVDPEDPGVDPEDPVVDPEDPGVDSENPSDKVKDSNEDIEIVIDENVTKGNLPNTATNMFNYLMLGGLFLALGLIFMIKRRNMQV